MAAGKVKVLAVEVDGVDLADATERTLTVDDLPFGEVGDSEKVYESGGNITAVEFFRSSTQTDGNRKARTDLSYDSSGRPSSEVWVYYEDDGTTIKRTITVTHTWSGDSLTSSTQAVT